MSAAKEIGITPDHVALFKLTIAKLRQDLTGPISDAERAEKREHLANTERILAKLTANGASDDGATDEGILRVHQTMVAS